MKKIFKFLMVIALVVLFNPVIAKADSQKGLFRADYDVTVNDEMEGSGFIAGNNVIINNRINGILFGAGYSVNVTGQSDYAFVAGNEVNIKGASFKDGFLAGQTIEIEGVEAARDIYAAGQNISLKGSVGRNLYIAGESVVLENIAINGDVYIDSANITINSDTIINGKLSYNEDANIVISKMTNIGSTSTYKNQSVNFDVDPKVSLGTRILAKLVSTLTGLLNILVVGILMILLIPRLFNKLGEIKANRLLPSFAWGLLILVAVPIVSLITLVTYIGVSTGIIATVLYGVLVYVSTILSTYTVTSLILKDKVKNPYFILLIGLSCLYLIKLIPFLGALVSFVMICLGLGLLTNLIKRK